MTDVLCVCALIIFLSQTDGCLRILNFTRDLPEMRRVRLGLFVRMLSKFECTRSGSHRNHSEVVERQLGCFHFSGMVYSKAN
jgi:hypothetical protein